VFVRCIAKSIGYGCVCGRAAEVSAGRAQDADQIVGVLDPARAHEVVWTAAVRTIHRRPSRSRTATSTRISFTLSGAATVELHFARARPGRLVGKRCAKPSGSNRARRRCTRFMAAGRLTIRARAGSNTVRFAGKLSRRKPLSAGSYRLTATPTDSSGNKGTARTARLKIVTSRTVPAR
jgi:hypothetical protein